MRGLLCGFAFASIAVFAAPAHAQTSTICTIVVDARSGDLLHESGDCRTRVTPASTFKIPLAVMGYDSGFLSTTEQPALPFKNGYADWGGRNWQQTTTPTRWMRFSVVWYSQQIAHALGTEKLGAYAAGFDYGNADFSGDPGRNNGLERSWISSSLKISPFEQTGFLRRLVTGQLPVSREAVLKTASIVEKTQASDGWSVWGKTGSAYPRNADGSLNRARGWGWFVGWATKGDTTLVFARLNQDEQRHSQSGGLRAREAFIAEWPELATTALQR